MRSGQSAATMSFPSRKSPWTTTGQRLGKRRRQALAELRDERQWVGWRSPTQSRETPHLALEVAPRTDEPAPAQASGRRPSGSRPARRTDPRRVAFGNLVVESGRRSSSIRSRRCSRRRRRAPRARTRPRRRRGCAAHASGASSARCRRASLTTSCAEGGSGGRGGRRSTKRASSRSMRKLKLDPPPSPACEPATARSQVRGRQKIHAARRG